MHSPRTPETPRRFRYRQHTPALLAILAVISALYATAPHSGEFWWSEAPRNALNGVFVRDLLLAMPLTDPAGYAIAYYLKYPSLTILFYPPLFYLLSAPSFALFGVSHAAALVPVILSYFALGAGVYALALRWFDRGPALGAALVLIAAPEIALWGRQVMLEIPCYVFLVWAVWILYQYLDGDRPWALYFAAFLFLCTLYVKQTVLFMAPVLVLLLVLYRGRPVWRDRHVWIVGALFAAGLVPLVLLTLHFGQANIGSVAGIDDAVAERWSLADWLWYATALPGQLGWPTLVLAGIGLAGMALRPAWRLPWRDGVFLAAWCAVGYLFFSTIALKEARHDVFILLPVVLVAIVPVNRLPWRHLSWAAAVAFGGVVLAVTLAWHPVPRIDGYRAAANFVADHAPTNSVILFSGYRDGSFVFNMRARDDRRDLTVLRADKILLRIAVRRELGVDETSYSEAEIADLLNNYGVYYVVAQADFWTDLAPMARLQAILRSPQFREVARIPVQANIPTTDRELIVYANLGPVRDERSRITIDMPIIGRQFNGAIN